MRLRFAIAFALAVLLWPAAALAASPHFITGPTASVTTSAVTISGKIAGLGNSDVTAVTNATVSVQCRNHGGNVAPGQNKSFTQTTTGLHPENGNLVFSITATPDLSGSCPNPSWTPEITGASGTITFFQGGVQVLSGSF
jgi:hypothetical protein